MPDPTSLVSSVRQAQSLDQVKPLLQLCKAGRLFDVQGWMAAGNPLNPPPHVQKGSAPRSPLEVAVEQGFQSLVLVLLRGGAAFNRSGHCRALTSALRLRRFDLVQLLVEHGYDPAAVDLCEVFETWDRAIMEYFIDRGADLDTGDPLAQALCQRIRTALGVFKRYREFRPALQRQADIALRYHCKEGNLKWVSLMLWAGADAYSLGPDNPGQHLDAEDEGYSALAYAALHRRFQLAEIPTPCQANALA